MTPKELVAEMRAKWSSTAVRTHFEECWRVHGDCAIERLCQEIERLDSSRCHDCDETCCHGKDGVE